LRAHSLAAPWFLTLETVTGTVRGSNPHSYAGIDALHAVFPLGLRAVTDEELQACAYERRGSLVNAAETAGQLWSEHWRWFTRGAAIIVLIATGVGGPVGLRLIAAVIDARSLSLSKGGG
jgi:hypothetical protein